MQTLRVFADLSSQNAASRKTWASHLANADWSSQSWTADAALNDTRAWLLHEDQPKVLECVCDLLQNSRDPLPELPQVPKAFPDIPKLTFEYT